MPTYHQIGISSSPRTRLFWGAFAIVFTLAAASAAAFFMFRPAEETYQNKNPKTSSPLRAGGNAPSGQLARDDDGDGLKNWEEALFRTDPANSDTDADGTPDNEEITQNRDPLKKGPDDKNAESADDTGTAEESAPNVTSQFMQRAADSLAPLLAQQQYGGAIDASDFASVASSLPTPDPVAVLGPIPKITKRDLVISDRNGPAAAKEYFNAVYAVYEQTFVTLTEDDLTILAAAAKTNDPSQLKKIDAVIAAFDESIRGVKKIPVPAGYEDFAIRELSYLLKSRRMVEILRNTETDPLAAIVIAPARIALMKEVRQFHQNTKQSLAAAGITFAPGEKGYTFFE